MAEPHASLPESFWLSLCIAFLSIAETGAKLAMHVRCDEDDNTADLTEISNWRPFRDCAMLSQTSVYIRGVNCIAVYLELAVYSAVVRQVMFLLKMLQQSSKFISVYLFLATLCMHAFALTGFMAFGHDTEQFRSYGTAMMSLAESFSGHLRCACLSRMNGLNTYPNTNACQCSSHMPNTDLTHA